MNSDNIYFKHHQALLQDLYTNCKNELPFSSSRANDVDLSFLDSLNRLANSPSSNDDYNYLGQTLISRIVSQYSHITPKINRDLFWYFGGDCLHFMSDEEINFYQQLDEMRFDAEQQGEPFDLNLAKTRLQKLH